MEKVGMRAVDTPDPAPPQGSGRRAEQVSPPRRETRVRYLSALLLSLVLQRAVWDLRLCGTCRAMAVLGPRKGQIFHSGMWITLRLLVKQPGPKRYLDPPSSPRVQEIHLPHERCPPHTWKTPHL